MRVTAFANRSTTHSEPPPTARPNAFVFTLNGRTICTVRGSICQTNGKSQPDT